MGIEALSRGAAHATFVDHDERARVAVRANLDVTHLAGLATVVAAEAFSFVETNRALFDLAVLDPPYAFDRWSELLAALPADIAVLESDREIDPGEGWSVARTRRYGTTVVTICRRSVDPQETST